MVVSTNSAIFNNFSVGMVFSSLLCKASLSALKPTSCGILGYKATKSCVWYLGIKPPNFYVWLYICVYVGVGVCVCVFVSVCETDVWNFFTWKTKVFSSESFRPRMFSILLATASHFQIKRNLGTGEPEKRCACEYVSLLQSFCRGALSLHWCIVQNF